MKKRLLSLTLAVLTVFAVVFAPAYRPKEVRAANTDYARQVAGLVNSEREANGLSYLKYSGTLSQAAVKRAEEIAVSFSHSRPDGSSCFTVLDEYGIGYYTAGENIAAGQRSPQAVMTSWMNSSGHRANILKSDFNFIGVGCVYSGDRYYWVQLFAGSNSLSGTVVVADNGGGDSSPSQETETKATTTTTTTTVATTASTTAKTTKKNDHCVQDCHKGYHCRHHCCDDCRHNTSCDGRFFRTARKRHIDTHAGQRSGFLTTADRQQELA